MEKTGRSFAASFEDVGVACFDFLLGLGVNRRITQWRAEIRGALKDRHVADFFSNRCDELDGGRTRADNAYALTGEIHRSVGPQASMMPFSLIVFEPWDIRHL